MTGGSSSEPHEGALGQVVDGVSDASASLSRALREQPMAALAVGLGAGFVAGGGLSSPLGTRITSATVRSTLGNLATIAALKLVRRGLEHEGGSGVRSECRAE